jgi:hypothetical protein
MWMFLLRLPYIRREILSGDSELLCAWGCTSFVPLSDVRRCIEGASCSHTAGSLAML